MKKRNMKKIILTTIILAVNKCTEEPTVVLEKNECNAILQ